jgi:hypothetical protein
VTANLIAHAPNVLDVGAVRNEVRRAKERIGHHSFTAESAMDKSRKALSDKVFRLRNDGFDADVNAIKACAIAPRAFDKNGSQKPTAAKRKMQSSAESVAATKRKGESFRDHRGGAKNSHRRITSLGDQEAFAILTRQPGRRTPTATPGFARLRIAVLRW